MEINICVPSLNNYQGLHEMIQSIEAGSLKPTKYYIIDNGGKLNTAGLPPNTICEVPGTNWGVAKSWNWFIDNVPEMRIILNDDLLFREGTLNDFVNGMSDKYMTSPGGIDNLNAFSFFSLPDYTVQEIGRFDENFAPAYFEDNDYQQRMKLKSFQRLVVNCSVEHIGSKTLKNYSSNELNLHHRNFKKNQDYFLQKWGGMPGQEAYLTPFNRG